MEQKTTIGRLLDRGINDYRAHWREFWALSFISLLCLHIGFWVLRTYSINVTDEGVTLASSAPFAAIVMFLLVIVASVPCLGLLHQIHAIRKGAKLASRQALALGLKQAPRVCAAGLIVSIISIAIYALVITLLKLALEQVLPLWAPSFIAILSMAVISMIGFTFIFTPMVVVAENSALLTALKTSFLLTRHVKRWAQAIITLSMAQVITLALVSGPYLLIYSIYKADNLAGTLLILVLNTMVIACVFSLVWTTYQRQYVALKAACATHK